MVRSKVFASMREAGVRPTYEILGRFRVRRFLKHGAKLRDDACAREHVAGKQRFSNDRIAQLRKLHKRIA